jgi:hypothetical protein
MFTQVVSTQSIAGVSPTGSTGLTGSTSSAIVSQLSEGYGLH